MTSSQIWLIPLETNLKKKTPGFIHQLPLLLVYMYMFQPVFFLAKFHMAAKKNKSSGMCANGVFERKGKKFALF